MDHNRCRACDTDFGTLESFDNHRIRGSVKEIAGDRTSRCTPPLDLGLTALKNKDGTDTWYTPGGLRKQDRMAGMRAAKLSK